MNETRLGPVKGREFADTCVGTLAVLDMALCTEQLKSPVSSARQGTHEGTGCRSPSSLNKAYCPPSFLLRSRKSEGTFREGTSFSLHWNRTVRCLSLRNCWCSTGFASRSSPETGMCQGLHCYFWVMLTIRVDWQTTHLNLGGEGFLGEALTCKAVLPRYLWRTHS